MGQIPQKNFNCSSIGIHLWIKVLANKTAITSGHVPTCSSSCCSSREMMSSFSCSSDCRSWQRRNKRVSHSLVCTSAAFSFSSITCTWGVERGHRTHVKTPRGTGAPPHRHKHCWFLPAGWLSGHAAPPPVPASPTAASVTNTPPSKDDTEEGQITQSYLLDFCLSYGFKYSASKQ